MNKKERLNAVTDTIASILQAGQRLATIAKTDVTFTIKYDDQSLTKTFTPKKS